MRKEAGQTAAEYVGVLLVVAAIIAAVATSQIGTQIGCQAKALVQKIAGLEAAACGDPAPAPKDLGPDSDDDGVPDSIERKLRTDPSNPDTDGDGLTDGEENRHLTDPFRVDSDDDGVSDADEVAHRSNPHAADTDDDGISDADEIEMGTLPWSPDSDADGLDDNAELGRQTNPLEPDSDSDGRVDGEDERPKDFDGNLWDIYKGFSCGDSFEGSCPDADDPVRASKEYLLGALGSGMLAIGDLRDIAGALLRNDGGAALFSLAAVAPIFGDSAKVMDTLRNLARSADGKQRAALIRNIDQVIPEPLRRQAYDAATGGAYSKLIARGMPESAVKQLAQEGNDLKRLMDNADLSSHTVSRARGTQIFDAAKKNPPWRNPFRLGEAVGVETALAELERRGHYRVLIDGRPRKDGMRHGPDIVAIDTLTNRTVIIEAKGSVGGHWWATGGRLSGTRKVNKEGRVSGGYQTSAGWLRDKPERYMDHLRSSADAADQEAADRLEAIITSRGEYDAMVVNSTPVGAGGYGAGMDDAAERIREGGQVGRLDVIDVRIPPREK